MAGTRPSASFELEEPPLLSCSKRQKRRQKRLFLGASAPQSQDSASAHQRNGSGAGDYREKADSEVQDEEDADYEAEDAGLVATLSAQSAVCGKRDTQRHPASKAADTTSTSAAAQTAAESRSGATPAAASGSRASQAASAEPGAAADERDNDAADPAQPANLPQLQDSSSRSGLQLLSQALDRRQDEASVPSAFLRHCCCSKHELRLGRDR